MADVYTREHRAVVTSICLQKAKHHTSQADWVPEDLSAPFYITSAWRPARKTQEADLQGTLWKSLRPNPKWGSWCNATPRRRALLQCGGCTGSTRTANALDAGPLFHHAFLRASAGSASASSLEWSSSADGGPDSRSVSSWGLINGESPSRLPLALIEGTCFLTLFQAAKKFCTRHFGGRSPRVLGMRQATTLRTWHFLTSLRTGLCCASRQI